MSQTKFPDFHTLSYILTQNCGRGGCSVRSPILPSLPPFPSQSLPIRTQIDIYLHVIQSDGGVLPVSINVASLALVDAGVAMSDLVVACSAGYLDGMPVMVS